MYLMKLINRHPFESINLTGNRGKENTANKHDYRDGQQLFTQNRPQICGMPF
jgi:hypothetical protein